MKQADAPIVNFFSVLGRNIARLKPYRLGLLIGLAGFVVGVFWLAGIRFLLVHPHETHYHANFAVYINGERQKFDNFLFYEEVAACTAAYQDSPKGRVHMHDNVNDVIHVHDKRVTYADFFANIDWSLGKDFLRTDDALLTETADSSLKFALNGQLVDRVDNLVIGNMDRLLVSYGPKNEDINPQFASIASTAEEVNKYQDPASCSGLNGTGHDSLVNRLKRATFWE